jgi:putative transposase
VFVRSNGELKYLWRAVDQDGMVLDILVQNRRDKAAARRFFHRLMNKTRPVPRVVVTDKLRTYGAAHREVMPSVEHRSHKGLNNRAENSHQRTRQRDRAMKDFRSTGGAQRFRKSWQGRPWEAGWGDVPGLPGRAAAEDRRGSVNRSGFPSAGKSGVPIALVRMG